MRHRGLLKLDWRGNSFTSTDSLEVTQVVSWNSQLVKFVLIGASGFAMKAIYRASDLITIYEKLIQRLLVCISNYH